MVEFKNMGSKSVSCPHSLVATASRVTHPRAIEVEVCVIKTSLQIGLLSHFPTFYSSFRPGFTVLGDISNQVTLLTSYMLAMNPVHD